MIVGDQPIVTRRGIHMSAKSLETIGIHQNTQVYILPFHTFEHRPKEPGTEFPTDLLITPIPPKLWPFVIRFSLRLRNRPGTLERALRFFSENHINILFLEATRSGHHHAAINIHGQIQALENDQLKRVKERLTSLRATSERKIASYYRTLFESFQADEGSELDDFLAGIGFSADDKGPPAKGADDQDADGDKSANRDRCAKDSTRGRDKSPWWWSALVEEDGVKIPDCCPIKVRYSAAQGSEHEITWKNSDLLDIRSDCKNERKGDKDCCKNCRHKFDGLLMYLVHRYLKKYDEISLKCALETEVERARVEVRKIRAEHGTDVRADVKAKRQAEDQITPLKVMLDAIITYKRILSERFKIIIVESALSDAIGGENNGRLFERYPASMFLYNVLYYHYMISFPFFARDLSFVSALIGETKEAHGCSKAIARIIRGLQNLADQRPRLGGMETRLDLDPVVITPLEKLCHAYYHRAYDTTIVCSAEDSLIPFPEAPEPQPQFLTSSLPNEQSATVAVAARNTEDLTLRLCLLPVSSVRRFVGINLKEYWRSCQKECGPNRLQTERYFCENIGGDPAARHGEEGLESDNRSKGERGAFEESADVCSGSSRGLMHALAKTVYEFEMPSGIGQHTLNLWRVYNNTYEMSDQRESGSIYLLANASGREFHQFDDSFPALLREGIVNQIHRGRTLPGQNDAGPKHVTVGRISTNRISGGRIFVSLSFSHPMWREWLGCIQRVGWQMGFSSVEPVQTRTEPVTQEVCNKIRDSHAMIQVLATPLPRADRKELERPYDLTWLNAEYLTAVSMGLYVVRLIERCSQSGEALRIGRDHPAFYFSVDEPFETFESRVEEAYRELASKLADKLGFQEIEAGRRSV